MHALAMFDVPWAKFCERNDSIKSYGIKFLKFQNINLTLKSHLKVVPYNGINP